MFSNRKLFEKSPSLAPWYFREQVPKLIKGDGELRWKWVEKVAGEYIGAWLLVDQKGSCLGIANSYTYLYPSKDNREFLAWMRSGTQGEAGPEIKLSLYRNENLAPIPDWEEVLLKRRDEQAGYFYFNCQPAQVITVSLAMSEESTSLEAPELSRFDDFCLVTEVPGLYPDGDKRWHDTAVILIRTKEQQASIYPQDWFNQSDADFDYQWITQAVKVTSSGALMVRGIRMDRPVILDRSNRQVHRRTWLP